MERAILEQLQTVGVVERTHIILYLEYQGTMEGLVQLRAFIDFCSWYVQHLAVFQQVNSIDARRKI